MKRMESQELLQNERVKEEINRHRWIESEKAGADIGFEKASSDWLNRFSAAWVKVNLAKKRTIGRSAKRV